MTDLLALANLFENMSFLVAQGLGNQHEHRLPERLLGRVAKQPFSRRIPGIDDAGQILADDRVIRGFDDGGVARHQFGIDRRTLPAELAGEC